MTAAEARRYLRVSENTFTRLVRYHGLPACRLGRALRIYRPALDEWLLARPANGKEAPMGQGGTHA